LETFRCPTCIGVLPDAYARRCGTCGQGLHRRRSRAPKVLGDDRRLAGKQLPVDRWMLERLYGEHRRKRTQMPPVAWHGRFVPSPASAEPDVQRPPVMEPPQPFPIEPSLRHLGDEIDALADLAPADVTETLAVDAILVEEAMLVEEVTPATVDALHLDMFVAPAVTGGPPEAPAALVEEPEPPVREADAVAPMTLEPMTPEPVTPEPATARPIQTHESLDPEVRALVDELYEQARAEMSGFDVSFEEPAPAPAPAPEPELRQPEPPAPPAPPAPPTSSGPSASTASAVGDVIPQSSQSRSGWVPAFLAVEQRRITD
jgi:hypothetical protein